MVLPIHLIQCPQLGAPGLKRACNAFSKTPPSSLKIYQQQEFYEPTTDGLLGTSHRDPDADLVEDETAPWE